MKAVLLVAEKYRQKSQAINHFLKLKQNIAYKVKCY